MKVTVAQDGGLAAGIRRPPITFDLDTLKDEDRAELQRLVSAAVANPSREGVHSSRARDVITYRVTVEDGSDVTILEQTDADKSPQLSELLNWSRRRRD